MADPRQPNAATYQVEPDFAARQSLLWAIAWLVGAATIALVAQILLVRPQLGGLLPFLDYGHLRGVADTALVFGWLATLGFAAIFALLPRIAEVQLHNEPLGAATTLTWSVIVTGGIVGLLVGVNQGRPLAELGVGADIGMTLMLVMVFYNAVVTVVRRRERTLYASGWFLLAAALVAPLIFVIGNLPLFTGVVDSIVSGFYLNALELLWFLPIGLGIAHYVVPVETGSALYSSALARTTFWSLVFAGGWQGQRFFLKGPAPDFLDTIAVGMAFVLLIPALSTAANLFATARDRWHLLAYAYGLRWAATGVGFLVAWISLVVVTTIPSVNRFFGVTAWQSATRYLAILGVFSSFGFALISHLYPLMVGRGWYSKGLQSFHFWGTTIGTAATVTLLLATGAAQGPAGGTNDVVNLLRLMTTSSIALVAAAQYALAVNAFRTSRSGPLVVVTSTPLSMEAMR